MKFLPYNGSTPRRPKPYYVLSSESAAVLYAVKNGEIVGIAGFRVHSEGNELVVTVFDCERESFNLRFTTEPESLKKRKKGDIPEF